jgi:hypothetical protein
MINMVMLHTANFQTWTKTMNARKLAAAKQYHRWTISKAIARAQHLPMAQSLVFVLTQRLQDIQSI